MRERVRLLARRYKEIEQIQYQWHNDEITELQMRQRYATHMPQWSIPPLMPTGEVPVTWKGQVFQHYQITLRGQVAMIQHAGRVTLRSKGGPLNWEVCLEDLRTSAQQSKN